MFAMEEMSRLYVLYSLLNSILRCSRIPNLPLTPFSDVCIGIIDTLDFDIRKVLVCTANSLLAQAKITVQNHL